MHKFKNDKTFIIIIFTVLLVVVISLIARFLININVPKYEAKKIIANSNINLYEFIKNRTFLEEENILYIGKNKKEIENGYYDIKVEYSKEKLNVFFNKLYVEEYSDKVYVDQNYLYEILNIINKKYDLKLEEIKLQELVILISDNYLEFRESKLNEKSSQTQDINLDYYYNFLAKENMLVFNIYIK